MNREENCGCGEHGKHHVEPTEEKQEGRGEDCGCGGHGQHHGMNREGHHSGNCGCGCHDNQGDRGMSHGCRCGCHGHEMGGWRQGAMMGHHMMGIGFGRRFISREEIIARLEEYQKQLQAEAKGVEEHIAELKKKGESQPA